MLQWKYFPFFPLLSLLYCTSHDLTASVSFKNPGVLLFSWRTASTSEVLFKLCSNSLQELSSDFESMRYHWHCGAYWISMAETNREASRIGLKKSEQNVLLYRITGIARECCSNKHFENYFFKHIIYTFEYGISIVGFFTTSDWYYLANRGMWITTQEQDLKRWNSRFTIVFSVGRTNLITLKSERALRILQYSQCS